MITCNALSCLQGLSDIGTQVVAGISQHIIALCQLPDVSVGGLTHLRNAEPATAASAATAPPEPSPAAV